MRHTVERYSDYVRRFLQPGGRGTVHSVYRKTANVLLAGRLFALQERNSPLSPISLITSLSEGEMVSLGIAAGQSVTVTEDEILIGAGSHRFHFAGAEQIPLALNGGNEGLLSPVQLSRLRERVAQALTQADTGGFKYAVLCLESGSGGEELLASSPVLSAALERMGTARELMRKRRWDEAAAALVRLIGLGSGLTPSGDDFLCGVLAGLRLCGKSECPFALCLQRLVREHLTDTNDISRAFLRCALEGYFSQAVVELRRVPDPETILRSFLSIGHSSGIDSLSGILYALKEADIL